MPQLFSWSTEGELCRGSSPFVPVGTNYRVTPGAGREVIRADFRAIAATGLNAVRIVAAGGIDPAWAREALNLATANGLAIQFAAGPDLAEEGALPASGFVPLVFSARPSTHLLGFDGLSDPFFHGLLPFAVRRAAAGGAVLVVALGVGAPLGHRVVDAWLRAALPAARAAGAAGFFWADWRGGDGMLDQQDRLRVGREFLGEFARVPTLPAPRPRIGLWVGSDPDPAQSVERRLALADYFLGLLGRDVRLVTRADQLNATSESLVVPGVPVSAPAQAGLRRWVEQGGQLFWHGPDPLTWDDERLALLGARPIDWRSGRGISVQAFGERFTLAHFPDDVRAELAPEGANILAADHQGFPLLLENQVGRGRVRYALPLVEDAITPVAAHPTSRDRWLSWYRGMLA